MPPRYSSSIIASLVALSLLASAPARADIAPSTGVSNTISLQYAGATYGQFRSFSYTLGSGHDSAHTVLAGGLSFNTSPGSFASYCVELGQLTSSSSSTYKLASFDSATVASGLARLYQVASAGSSSVLSTANGSAAFQAAVWEVVNESSSTYSLASGSFSGHFRGRTTGNAITNQATTWLNAVNSFSGTELYKAQTYTSTKFQDQLVITSVPEPETYAMLLAGLGLMGAVARRRKPV